MCARRLLNLLGRISFASVCLAQTTAAADTPQPVATINGQPVYESELLPLVQAPIRQIRSHEYEVKSRARENLVSQKLLEVEAKNKKCQPR